MARLPRITLPGIPQHIIQRGNNRQACFASEEDFSAYSHWLAEYSQKYKVALSDGSIDRTAAFSDAATSPSLHIRCRLVL